MTGTGIAFSDTISFSENFNRCRTLTLTDGHLHSILRALKGGSFAYKTEIKCIAHMTSNKRFLPQLKDAKTNHKGNVSGIITERNFNLQSRFGN